MLKIKSSEVTIHPPVATGNTLRVSAALRTPEGQEHLIYYDLPKSIKGWLTRRADPFLVQFIMPAMKLGHPLHVHGTVSRVLIENITDYQCIWNRWDPEQFSVVPVTADKITDKREGFAARKPEPLLPFSGGMDSLHSVLRWTGGGKTPMPGKLRQAVMVHGYDIELEAEEFFTSQFVRFKPLLAKRGISLTKISTNVQDLARAFDLKWGKTIHGPSLGALLLLFQKRFSTGLIAATYTCNNLLIPWGSSIVTDHLMSSGQMTIRHDGTHHDRLTKTMDLCEWPEAFRDLTTCYQRPRTSINCGACYKCCASQIVMEIAGAKEKLSVGRTLDETAIRNMDCGCMTNVITLHRWIKVAEVRTPDAWWLPILRETAGKNLVRYEKEERGLRGI